MDCVQRYSIYTGVGASPVPKIWQSKCQVIAQVGLVALESLGYVLFLNLKLLILNLATILSDTRQNMISGIFAINLVPKSVLMRTSIPTVSRPLCGNGPPPY